MPRNLRFALFLALAMVACVASGFAGDPLTIVIDTGCPPANCGADPGSFGSPATGNADFTPIGLPWTYNFRTANALTWCDMCNGYEYYATFGYGGSFVMTGPGGLTFTGVITSGFGDAFGTLAGVYVSYVGQWSNGLYGYGNVLTSETSPGNWGEHFTATQVTYSKVHDFTGGQDGSYPWAGLTKDRGGNLYGTTFAGGAGQCTNAYGQKGCGTVFKLGHKGSGWTFSPLYSFSGGNDGAEPQLGTLTVATDGSLYGTTVAGGGGPCAPYGPSGCGTVFHLKPPPRACTTALCPWTETQVYAFTNGSDGAYPNGGPVFDQGGNLYGTANSYPNNGNIYKLTPSGASWTHSIAYAFSGSPDGHNPIGELIFDSSGNLYGTTYVGGAYGRGTAFQLEPSGPGWTENVLYSFQDQAGSSGGVLYAGVIIDSSGNLYGATVNGGTGGGGTVFALIPSSGNWALEVVSELIGSPYCGVYNDLVMDNSGNLYGTTNCGGAYGYGSVFKLTTSGTYTDLYDFTGGSDGGNPYSNVVLDANGNLYGTTYSGGANGMGVVWEITP